MKWLSNLIRRYSLSDLERNIALNAGATWTETGQILDHKNIFGLPEFVKAVNLLSNTVARCCPYVYQYGDNNSREVAKDHPLYDLLRYQPNPLANRFEFFKTVMANVIVTGNAYIWIQRDQMFDVQSLWVLDSTNMTPVVVWDGMTPDLSYVFQRDTEKLVLYPHEIVHIKGLSVGPGLVGWRFLDYAAASLGVGLAVQSYSSTFFRNNCQTNQWIELPGNLRDAEAVANFRSGITTQHAGTSNAHKLMILQGGAKLNSASVNNNETQMLESKRFSLLSVANLLNIPAHKLDPSLASGYGSLESENLAALGDCYAPYLDNIELQLNNKLLKETERGRFYIELDRSELLVVDRATLVNTDVALLNNGAMSWEEFRQKHNLPTEKNPDEEWRIPSGVTIDGDEPPAPAPIPGQQPAVPDPQTPQNDPTTKQQETDATYRAIMRATCERLQERLKRFNKDTLNDHKKDFQRSLPGCDGAIEEYFASLQEEWDAVLPEQRPAVVEKHNLFDEVERCLTTK